MLRKPSYKLKRSFPESFNKTSRKCFDSSLSIQREQSTEKPVPGKRYKNKKIQEN